MKRNYRFLVIGVIFLIGIWPLCCAKEYHVSREKGHDNNKGTIISPFQTINAASQIARSGDTITVHSGIYREMIEPPRGGRNEFERILYRAASGEHVEIKGSEIIKEWEKVRESVWKAIVPNTLFGNYNPYDDLIYGDWYKNKGIHHHTGEVYLNKKALFEKNSLEEVLRSEAYPGALDSIASTYTWYTEVDEINTTIWANFQSFNPNKEMVEINVRKSCFYPCHPGVNYISISGFIMSMAATQWAAPTAEQIGLIGTHWSKGWLIENNTILNSKCVGISLGKDRATGHNTWSKNPLKDGATQYNEVIIRALQAGWSKEKIGSHIVRNNTIFDCGQAGIVGSLGAIFSIIDHNHIYNIWSKRDWEGFEMAGIKIHGAIDVVISRNRVHNCSNGIWMDWMAQGTRISGNILYSNSHVDLFMEVNHGPYLVDNNILLSTLVLRDWSEGGAYVHNLFYGNIDLRKVLNRSTPYHLPHSTRLMGIRNIHAGDNRFFNNIFVRKDGNKERVEENLGFFSGTHGYKLTALPNLYEGNVYYHNAMPNLAEEDPVLAERIHPMLNINEDNDELYLELIFDDTWLTAATSLVTSQRLGSTVVSDAIYEQPDSQPYVLNLDFYGSIRDPDTPTPGPFEKPENGRQTVKIWETKTQYKE